MTQYLQDPNNLIRNITSLNAQVRQLREEGWTIELKLSGIASQIHVKMTKSHSCDPLEDLA